jgi:hypothetical protein
MASATEIAETQRPLAVARWNVATRIAFRFCFVYFGLYCLATQILTTFVSLPDSGIPDLATLWPVRLVPQWAATHIFHLGAPLAYADTGSGDRMFDWVLVFCILIVSALAVAVWSILDRRRANYIALSKWFRVFLRFALAGQMFAYGLAKAVPLQMPFPFLTRLVEPYGSFSPMGVLWSSIGAAPAYESFAGCAELLAGVLLVFPRTALVGALVCLADVTQVSALNMTYDVPVKLFSLHLMAMAVFLLAPEIPRLAGFFFLNRPVGPSTQPQLFATRRANRIALAAQVAVGAWLLAINGVSVRSAWTQIGGGRPKSPLYGIWDVEQLSVDGQPRPPLLADSGRWRRAIFDIPSRMDLQRMDDSFVRYGASIKVDGKTLALTKRDDKNWGANLSFEREPQDQLILDGEMDGHKIHMQLHLVDHTKFLLTSRGFHWIQEGPFNR